MNKKKNKLISPKIKKLLKNNKNYLNKLLHLKMKYLKTYTINQDIKKINKQ